MVEEDRAGGCCPEGSATTKQVSREGAYGVSGWEGFIDLPCLFHPFAEGQICLQAGIEQKQQSKWSADPTSGTA